MSYRYINIVEKIYVYEYVVLIKKEKNYLKYKYGWKILLE